MASSERVKRLTKELAEAIDNDRNEEAARLFGESITEAVKQNQNIAGDMFAAAVNPDDPKEAA